MTISDFNLTRELEFAVLADLAYGDPHPAQSFLRRSCFAGTRADLYDGLTALRDRGMVRPGTLPLIAWLQEHGRPCDPMDICDLNDGITIYQNVRPKIDALLRRSADTELQQLGQRLSDGNLTTDDKLNDAQATAAQIRSVIDRDDTESDEQIDDDLATEIEGGIEDPRRVATGLPALDAYGTMEPGSIQVVGAGTGIGKTAFAVTLAINAAMVGVPVCYVTAEEPRRTIRRRFAKCYANVAGNAPLDQSQRMLRMLPLTTAAARHMSGIVSAVAQDQATHGTRLVIIDHLQEIYAERRDERIRELDDILRAIRDRIADERNVAVLLLAQLSRRPDQRTDHVPIASDLRDSGRTEFTADRVWLLHRPTSQTISTDLWIRKNRTGPKDVRIRMELVGSASRFIPAEPENGDRAW